MTACLYMSPPWDIENPDDGFLPVVLADTMVTLRGVIGEPLLPILGSSQGEPINSTILKRKLNFVGPCAVALSGEGDAIEQVIRRTDCEIEEWSKLDRPMKPFAEYLSTLNKEYYRRPRLFGTAVMRGRDGMIHRGAPLGTDIQLPHYGLAVAHGSGGNDLLNHLRDADYLMGSWDPIDLNPFVKANAFVNLLNGRKLIQELLRGSQKSWGGFMEWAYLEDSGWKFGPSVLHCFMFNEKQQWPDGISNRFLAYDPHIGTGALLSVSANGISSFALSPIIPDRTYRSTLRSQDWIDWKPDFINVSVALNPADPEMMFNKTLNRDEMDYVDLKVDEIGIKGQTMFPNGYLEKLLSEAYAFGRMLKPQS